MIIWISFLVAAHIEQLPIITDLVFEIRGEIALALRAVRNLNPTAVWAEERTLFGSALVGARVGQGCLNAA